jgi:purine-binding chemotaxis protein CheW
VTIILRNQNSQKTMVVGIVVDAVSEVYKFDKKSIRTPPTFGNKIDRCFLQGLASIEDRLIILLDSHSLLDQNELYHVESKAEEA